MPLLTGLAWAAGIYTRKNAKQQKHNMVHVEIFVGGETGEASLGARWQKGRCKIFDSYKFTSKNYHSIQYYYRYVHVHRGRVALSC